MGFRASLGIFARPKLRYLLAPPCLLAALGLPASARAEDPLLKQLFDRQAAAAIERAKSPQPTPVLPAEGAQILVLTDGRVVDGTIRADLHGCTGGLGENPIVAWRNRKRQVFNHHSSAVTDF